MTRKKKIQKKVNPKKIFPWVESNPGPLALKARTLPLRHVNIYITLRYN